MKQLVINHRSSFSSKMIAVTVFEWRDYSLVMCLENAGAVWGNNRTFSFFMYLGDKQHNGQ
jgi:hypothetical protein